MDDLSRTLELYASEDLYPSLDLEKAFSTLSAAVACRTITGADDGSFEKLHELIASSYPAIMEHASVEKFGNSLLITVKGGDSALAPVILISHQDVVYADDEGWTHPPFSGHMDDDYIWGRGSLDIKSMLFAELEALESALLDGLMPERTVILAFGDDEETESAGATRLAAVLKSRGVRDAFLVDEGTTSYGDAASFGAPGSLYQGLCLSQKGFLTVRVHAKGEGGHSSNPFGSTSLEKLCTAVGAIRASLPGPRMTPLLAAGLEALGVSAHDEMLESLACTRESFPFACDTMALTQIEGSSPSANALPFDASATINFRLLPGCDIDAFFERICEAAGDAVSVELVHATPGAREDSTDNELYGVLASTLSSFYPSVSFIPLFMCGGCDAIRYEAITSCSVRVLPYLAPPSDQARIHCIDERIPKRSYAQAIRVLRAFLDKACFTR